MLQLDGDARRRLVGWLRVPDGFLLSGGGSQPQTGAGSQMVLYLQSVEDGLGPRLRRTLSSKSRNLCRMPLLPSVRDFRYLWWDSRLLRGSGDKAAAVSLPLSRVPKWEE